jgi:hypothetical protein
VSCAFKLTQAGRYESCELPVNGLALQVQRKGRVMLADALRSDLHPTGTKNCCDQGSLWPLHRFARWRLFPGYANPKALWRSLVAVMGD